MNISINKKVKLTFSEFKDGFGKHFRSYTEKIRDQKIKEKYMELYPEGKVYEQAKTSSKRVKKDQSEIDTRESDSEEQSGAD